MAKITLHGGPLDGREYESRGGSSIEFPIPDEEKMKFGPDIMDRWSVYWNGWRWVSIKEPYFNRAVYQRNQNNEYVYIEE